MGGRLPATVGGKERRENTNHWEEVERRIQKERLQRVPCTGRKNNDQRRQHSRTLLGWEKKEGEIWAEVPKLEGKGV